MLELMRKYRERAIAEFLIAGFRNKNLSAILYPKDQRDLRAQRAASGRGRTI